MELLTAYSISEILIFIVLLALTIKGFVTFWDWAIERLRKVFKKEQAAENKEKEMRDGIAEAGDKLDEVIDQISTISDQIDDMKDVVDTLVDSDRDDIKAFLTREHHYFCYQKGWIDDYSLECCEKRYQHYIKEGGNSFIEGFMKEIRALPKQPPNSEQLDR